MGMDYYARQSSHNQLFEWEFNPSAAKGKGKGAYYDREAYMGKGGPSIGVAMGGPAMGGPSMGKGSRPVPTGQFFGKGGKPKAPVQSYSYRALQQEIVDASRAQ